MEPQPTATMTETQQYLERIQAITENTKSPPQSRKASLTSSLTPSTPRKASLTAAFAAITITATTDTGQSLMSSADHSQSSTRDISQEEQKETQTPSVTPQNQAEDQSQPKEVDSEQPQFRRPPMPQGDNNTSSNQSSSSDMSDSKLSRFYHAMGSSDSGAAERREAEERARREAEERARRASEGK